MLIELFVVPKKEEGFRGLGLESIIAMKLLLNKHIIVNKIFRNQKKSFYF